MKKVNRLGIFVFYDKDNIVDDYVCYLLDDFVKNVNHLVIISNSKLDKKEKKKFDKYDVEYIERENIGLDAGALCEYFNSTKDWQKYDEVSYLNDTFFGPFYPLTVVFEEMQKRKCDFWGLTYGNPHTDYYGEFENRRIPRHIQSFFITFKKNVTNSDSFINYWKNYDINKLNSFQDVVVHHELKFTKYLNDNGFIDDVYVHDNDVDDDFNRNYVEYVYNSIYQIINNKTPFIKRKVFSFDRAEMLSLTDSNNINKVIDYIKNNTDYDLNLIWKNIYRMYNVKQIAESIGFNKLLVDKSFTKYDDVTYFIRIDNCFMLDEINNNLKGLVGKIKLFTKEDKIYNYFKNNYDIVLIKKSWQEEIKKAAKNIKTDYVGYFWLKDNKKFITIINESVVKNTLDCILEVNRVQSIIEKIKNNNLGIAYGNENLNFTFFYDNLFWTDELFNLVSKVVNNERLCSRNIEPLTKSENWLVKKDIFELVDFDCLNGVNDELFSLALSVSMMYLSASKNKHTILVYDSFQYERRLDDLNIIYKETYRAVYRNNMYVPVLSSVLKQIDTQREERRFIYVLKRVIKDHILIPIKRLFKK